MKNIRLSTPLTAKRLIASLALLTAIGTAKPSNAASPPGDVVGKLNVGYQGWFAAPGDGSPVNNWYHYAAGFVPGPGHATFEMWPDTREYTTTFPTNFANRPDGKPSNLFSSYTDQTVQTHFRWMSENGIDGAGLQRFGVEISPGSTIKAQRDGMAQKVMSAAQNYGRKFYIMYDVSGWGGLQAGIKADWTNTIVNTLHLTSSSAYAKQNGKPVVCIWGMGYANAPIPGPGDATQCLDVVNWFKAQGCYVIGGVPGQWRSGSGDSRSDFGSVYSAMNMISPWSVGRPADAALQPYMQADINYCNTLNIDYQPVLYPGFSYHNGNGSTANPSPFQRLHGDFMWNQFVAAKNVGATNIYVAMFDEIDEATAIFKVSENANMQPPAAQNFFLPLNADGVELSSDFYLRLVNDGARMIKGQIPLQSTHPTKHKLQISLRSSINSKYVCAVNAGNDVTLASSTAVGPWEIFAVTDKNGDDWNHNDTINLRAPNGSYFCAEGGGGSTLSANRAIPGEWETFTIVKTSGTGAIANGNTVALRSSGGKYLTVNSSSTSVDVTGTSIGTAQTFTLNFVP